MSTAQLEKILDHLSEQRLDLWGNQASIIANGIRQSGIGNRQSSIEPHLKVIDDSIDRLGSVVSAGLMTLHHDSEAALQVLGVIAFDQSHPLQARAREFAQRGSKALQRGWWGDAIAEFGAAIDHDKYEPAFQFGYGVALARHGERAMARDAFLAAAKYADDHSVIAGASLAAIQQCDEQDQAAQLAVAGVERSPQCPELLFAAAKLTGDVSYTRRGLEIAPGLAVQALAENVPGVEQVADALVRDNTGVVHKTRQVHDAAQRFAGLMGHTIPLPRIPENASDTAKLMTASGVWALACGEAIRAIPDIPPLRPLPNRPISPKKPRDTTSRRAGSLGRWKFLMNAAQSVVFVGVIGLLAALFIGAWGWVLASFVVGVVAFISSAFIDRSVTEAEAAQTELDHTQARMHAYAAEAREYEAAVERYHAAERVRNAQLEAKSRLTASMQGYPPCRTHPYLGGKEFPYDRRAVSQ